MDTGISLAARQTLAGALVTEFTGGTSGATLRLFQNNFTPTPLSLVGDFTECNFTGYGAKTALTTWRTWNDADDASQVVDQTIIELFAAGAISAPQTAYGWYLTDAAGTVLLAWGRFDEPYTFIANGDKLPVSPAVKLLLNTGQANVPEQ